MLEPTLSRESKFSSHPFLWSVLLSFVAPLFGVSGTACGSSSGHESFVDEDSGTGAGANGSSTPDGGTPGNGNPGVFNPGGETDAGAPTTGGDTLLYAHTDKTLFSFDPKDISAAPVSLGDFDCIDGSGAGAASAMTDLGVTKDGKLYGVSEKAVYPLIVKNGSVHCDATWPLPTSARFYGLTVAPENTVASSEVLIAANGAGQLFQVDATSGAPIAVGNLGKDPKSGLDWSLSGDIVFLANSGHPIGFATVRTCTMSGKKSSCETVDTLIEVDVQAIKAGAGSVLKSIRGPVKKGAWCTNASSPSTFGSMFGIAALGDKVYGFSRKGAIVEINNNDGSGCLVASYTSDLFAGAGVTTTAPVTAPPPK